jgi:DNA-binding XRE family transcriptional regulator
MHEYSRPLGDAVRTARIQHGYTQKQLADELDVDERTIISIENYRSNTTIEILYPLLRLLEIDARKIFSPELEQESQVIYRFQLLIKSCTEEEATTLLSVCDAVLAVLRNKTGLTLE